MNANDARNTAVLLAAAEFAKGATLESVLEYAFRMGRISGLESGIEALSNLTPAPDSRKVQA